MTEPHEAPSSLGDLVESLGVEFSLISYIDDPRSFAVIDWNDGPIIVELRGREQLIVRLELGSGGDYAPDADDELSEQVGWDHPDLVIAYDDRSETAWLSTALSEPRPEALRWACEQLVHGGRRLRPRLAEDLWFDAPLDYPRRSAVGPL